MERSQARTHGSAVRVCLLLAGSAMAVSASMASAGGPVAHAVLFYSPACGHCRDLIGNYLPSVLHEYGNRLQILSIDAADPAGRRLFQAAVTNSTCRPEIAACRPL